MKQLVITLIGTDRPGLVETLSDTVFKHHGNWQASSLSKLAGKFAGIIQIDIKNDDAKALSIALDNISELDVLITDAPHQSEPDSTTHSLTVTGNDRPGIIQEVTREIAKFGININNLESTAQSAANSGGVIFMADFDLDIANTTSLDDLGEALEGLSDDLIVEFDVNDIH
ncbi:MULTISPECIES: glycine cleavage system protein R [Enterovibrio]|uniref:Glycine cleavage system transcriptional repressor n=1 Tax=Enterovibrio norvegicus FF-454 TaxID=1185651 RepID=A0A1E5BYD9_9GAMM|nr:ACT domain-containing protein [Enterovibrio norvegicus]OEE58251.1 amino acid-binding protein [Enterovibrio norvegicus FF-454]OEE89850.1 amino acid-binding protein [Enterovibrio norvegicus FF-162]